MEAKRENSANEPPTAAGNDWRALNRANWDERVAVHLASPSYDLAALRAGNGRLNAIEEAELGDVAGLRIVHLQCHFGRDSLILASRGAAEVVGVDFSTPAIAPARSLADELGLPARFVEADLYDAPAAVGGTGSFDLVYTTWGTIGWLPDIAGWARVVATLLRPGGTLYFADGHPTAQVFDDLAGEADATGLPRCYVPYFESKALVIDDPRDYADPQARLTSCRTVEWMHPLGAIIGALRGAGLRLDWLNEHPRVAWQMFRCLVRDSEGCWAWPDRPWLPLSLSLRAIKDP
jgi:SAM-dependent methyltransferase